VKKLLFVISQLYRGGAETSLVNLLNHLDKNKYEIDLVILNQSPVKGAVSLIDSIPSWVKVCDAYKNRNLIGLKIKGKFIYNQNQKDRYYLSALDFVRNKMYDWAFFVGEWHSPEFVAVQVNAHKKAAWIHNDLSKAEYFNEEEYFYYYDYFDKYIFVSENSLKSSCKKYKFLKDKAVTIYNINDINKIKEAAKEPVDDYKFGEKLTLVTCANFREQKNHLRQVEVMKVLKRRGIDFRWINIGAITDKAIVSRAKKLAKDYNLENDFLILGPKSNPYKYISRADAVTVLSDYESWSMVITEAKILGVPVISTRTSGALEQIENIKTGILTNFTVTEIADSMESFIKSKELQASIRKNINSFDNTKEILESFTKLVDFQGNKEKLKSKRDKILYIIDEINYLGGAHIATKYQINKLLEKGQDITIFSSSIPRPGVRNELLGVEFLSWRDLREDTIFNMRLFGCLTNKFFTIKEKKFKFKLSYAGKILKVNDNFEKNVLSCFERIFSNYDVICVMSEGSAFKEIVAKAKCKKKIQWIHIDYCDWKDKTEWAIKMTKNDRETWKAYDDIIVLTESIKQDICKIYPHLKNKIKVMKNIMPENMIKMKANIKKINDNRLNFVTVGRVDKQKAYERLVMILGRLRSEGYKFYWTVIGDGNERSKIENMIIQNELDDVMFMEGAKSNPFPYIKDADVFALMSDFEGLPNTIYESLILGVPVIATNVGGVKTQVINGQTGWLVENDEESIYNGIKEILDNPNEVEIMKEKLKNYVYDNEKIYKDTYDLFLLN
jgi:Glycosyltransferase